MKRLIKGGLSGILVVLLVVTMMPTAAFAGTGVQGAQQVSSRQIANVKAGDSKAQRATAAMEKFAEAMNKFASITGQTATLAKYMTRFAGVTNIASGVVGILQMAGVIQDPVMAKLGEILNTVKNIESQLTVMDRKLDELNQQIVSVEVNNEVRNRSNLATQRMKDWRDFQRDYCEPLQKMMNQYTYKVNSGLKECLENATYSNSGVNVIYTKDANGVALNYSRQRYSNGNLPAKADGGEVVDANSSFAVPGNLLPNTKGKVFNVKTYRAEFETEMKKNFKLAADNKTLKANNAFFTAWSKLSAAEKDKKAAVYASDILNSIIYQVTCDVMSTKENGAWTDDLVTAYIAYCNNILKQDSGVHARIHAMTLTHGFEGEIKDDIKKFCDSMIAQAGTYGQFALSCIAQSGLQNVKANIDENVQGKVIDTIMALSEKAKNTITGYDNFCYVTYTVLSQETVKASSSVTVVTQKNEKRTKNSKDKEYFALRDQSATPWLIGVPSILNDVYAQVLYRQYQATTKGTISFAEYLHKYGAFKDEKYTGQLLTKVVGSEAFPLSEGIPMTARRYDEHEEFFTDGETCNVNVGNISKVEDQYFYVHDRLVTNEMNMGTGSMTFNKTGAARAYYGECHWYWRYDEPWIFAGEGVDVNTRNTASTGSTTHPRRTYVSDFTKTFTVLKSSAKLNLNGENYPENPLYAFDQSLFIDGVSNWIGPSYENNKTTITSMKLNKTKFKYTGKAIKPKVTVKAGKKTVSAKNYTVKYLDNKAVGTATVVVTGKGKYAGMLSKNFSIVSKSGKAAKANTESKMVAKGKNAMTISWPAVKKADGYDVFFARCDHDGKKNKYKKVKTINSDKKHSYTKKGLKSGVSYKAKVRAFVKVKGKKKYIMTSPTLHAYSGNGTKHFTNAKSVTVKKTYVTLKKGKTYKIKATVTKQNKNKKLMPSSHMKKLRYRSMNKKIATVTKAGKIKAKAKGKCDIYVFAHNGVGKLVHVTVK